MKFSKINPWLLASTLLLSVACSKDNLEELKPENTAIVGKVIIANAGNFGKPLASISMVNLDLTQARNNVYGEANGDEPLGDVLQDVGFKGDNAYLVLNNSNKITVVDRNNFKKVKEITEGIKQPRYITFAGDYAYVTNDKTDYTTYVSERKLSIYNTKDFSLVKTIQLDNSKPAENIVTAGDKVFIQHASFGSGKDVSIVNTTSHTIEKTITFAENIKYTVAYNGYAYVLTSDANGSKISLINPSTNSVTSTYTYPVANASKLKIDQGKMYFTVKNNIYKVDLANAPEAKLFLTVKDNTWSTLYGFDVIDGKIFTADANKFTEASDVTIYSATDGKPLQSFKTGLGTCGFYLNK